MEGNYKDPCAETVCAEGWEVFWAENGTGWCGSEV